MNDFDQRLKIKRKNGSECFFSSAGSSRSTVLNFWQWAFSDLGTNSMRGIVAEFIVASALGVSRDVRNSWLEYDLTTKSGLKVEVKSAAYLQSWLQTKESPISFSVSKARRWAYPPARLVGQLKRHADIYVFCVLRHRRKRSLNPLNLGQWDFYVIDTKTLNKGIGNQKSLSFNKLLELSPAKTNYEQLRVTVNRWGCRCKKRSSS
jgi:hypothetical protein